ncbi:hypothetical protein ADU90_03340 [Clostridium botulinum]|uniref:Uncharacterized protein n=2 Tax=Clostridium botulinum TaxID=1491 RepID=A0A0A0IBS7_CLOBO|nr:hypothetical protein Z956_07160 [Clostridium botulinum D str. CCUG 7971]KGM98367.1 hypothetical protein Z955_11515 [Clostridium botulinum C/D str. DC5]KOC48062.1 hypothetical protein ADU88_08970 [Clostridium botulinum]OOV50801.1 hypothetical protein B1A66_12595 [Clostridium botulinum D/C]KOC53539.1 hypothetical protein ADU89_09015 [Clostridium botulinum]
MKRKLVEGHNKNSNRYFNIGGYFIMYEMIFLAIGIINLVGMAAVLLVSNNEEINMNVNNDNIENKNSVVLKKVS